MSFSPLQMLAAAVLRAYKRFISPLLFSSCRFTPTCSEYAMEAVERHGMFYGSALSAWRILRCNPFSRGGLDTVPNEQFLSSAGVSPAVAGASSPVRQSLFRKTK